MSRRNILNGFTLLEMLIGLLIISITLVFALPAWQQSHTLTVLEKEQRKLYLFLRHIQARAENSTDIWLLIANRDENQHWCLTAQIKSEHLCDCLYPQTCTKDVSAHFYYPYFPQQTMLISKRYYPNEITRLSGIRDTASSTCFVLQADKLRTLFSFFNVGSLKLKSHQSTSACINDEG